MEFEIGDVVCLRSQPSLAGAVIGVTPGEPETRYTVFIDGRRATYYASQIQPHSPPAEEGAILNLAEFQARLTALQINEPSLSTLYSLHAARVNFVPYQFRPVLKFVRSDRPRLLIADDVGVGKTIEAGLILRELQSRRDVESALIICPKPLVTERKWELEMKRFDEQFVPLDGPTLRHCITETDMNGEWPDRYRNCILPFSLFDEQLLYGGNRNGGRARSRCLLDLDPPPRFDLVVVDEAHHIRNTNTYVHQGVRFFCEHAEAVVFLTATPIQLRSDDLFVLLNILRPDLVLDRESFEHMAEPNPYINQAVNVARRAQAGWESEALDALMEAGTTSWGNALLRSNEEYRLVCERVTRPPLSAQERLQFIRDAESLHTFSNLINRTRRRDIGNFTTRKPETVAVPFTPPQQELHDTLLEAQARILRRAHGARSVKFLMTTLRRQAASCLYGLAPLIESILTRRINEVELDEADEDYEEIGEEVVTTIREDIEHVLMLASHLDSHDPKLEALLRILRDKQRMPNNKVLLFSSFRHTLRYLVENLRSEQFRIGLIHGDVPDAERLELRDRFRLPKEDRNAIDVLLSSEVGCEGLDYQFCDCLVNYDLGWNPMRIEQRIGRIDRYGQQSETVAIYNIVTPGTVDFDIYNRCLTRIGVFRQALGGSEEILGRITDQLRAVAENLELTDEERGDRLQQVADNEIRLIQEQERLEEQQVELFGIVLPPEQVEREVLDASSAWLTPSALQNLVQTYLAERCGGQDHILGAKALKTLRLSQEARAALLEDYRRLPRQSSPMHREWEKWLKGGEPLLEITFDATCAADSRGATFITPIHPLAQQAASIQNEAPPFFTAIKVTDASVAPGTYPFAIYLWRKHGLREDALLQPVMTDEQLTRCLLKAMQNGSTWEQGSLAFPDSELSQELQNRHYQLWAQEREAHLTLTRRLAEFRRQSLQASHAARIALLREQKNQATDARIRRMRDSQIASAEADFQQRLIQIQRAESMGDIVAEQVAVGVLKVERA